jgi:hypothetical protein
MNSNDLKDTLETIKEKSDKVREEIIKRNNEPSSPDKNSLINEAIII